MRPVSILCVAVALLGAGSLAMLFAAGSPVAKAPEERQPAPARPATSVCSSRSPESATTHATVRSTGRLPVHGGAPESGSQAIAESSSVDTNDAPYGTGMRAGATHLALTKPTPLEWIVRCMRAVPLVESMGMDCEYLTPDLIRAMADVANVRVLTVLDPRELPEASKPLLSDLRGVKGVRFGAVPEHMEAGHSAFLAPFLDLPDLQSVETQPEFPVSDEFLEVLSRSATITSLCLTSTSNLRRKAGVTTRGLNALARMRQLTELALTNMGANSTPIGPSELAAMLEALPNLKRLSLAGWMSRLKDEHLEACAPCLKRLTYLDIRNCSLTQKSHRVFGPGWMLQELLVSQKFSDTSAAHVAELPFLVRLEVSYSDISDIGVQLLAKKCPGLRYVSISGCRKVTDAGILSLRQLGLEVLHISDIPGLTAEGLMSLAKATRLQVLGLSELNWVDVEFLRGLVAQAPSLQCLYVFRCKAMEKSELAQVRQLFPGVTFIAEAPYRAEPLR